MLKFSMAQKRSDSSFKNKVDEEGKNSGKQNASFETNALNYNEEVFQLLMGVNKWTMYFSCAFWCGTSWIWGRVFFPEGFENKGLG